MNEGRTEGWIKREGEERKGGRMMEWKVERKEGKWGIRDREDGGRRQKNRWR